ncbi:MAG TPA: hypothetical protein VHE23_06495 [Candidatus Acidoferrales bacterium]|nr:hypothetical protein [Candidatus Acidoferrales bacterium]
MTLYEVPAESPYKRPFRILAGATIFLLVAMLLIAVYDPPELSDGTRKALGWVSAAIVLASVLGAMWLSTRQGLWKLQRECQVELSDTKISQRRAGSPVVEIPLNQIQSLFEGHGWLVVGGGEPTRKLVIPLDITGIEELKRELTQHGTVLPLKIKLSPLSLLPPVLVFLAIFFLLTSHTRAVVIVAGGAVLLVEGWTMYSVRRFFRSKSKTTLLILTYILTFLALVWLVYYLATVAM